MTYGFCSDGVPEGLLYFSGNSRGWSSLAIISYLFKCSSVTLRDLPLVAFLFIVAVYSCLLYIVMIFKAVPIDILSNITVLQALSVFAFIQISCF